MEITYEDLLQSEQILVKSKSLSDEQLQCLAKMQRAAPYPIVMFENGDLTKRNSELQRLQQQAESKEWLRTRGLLGSLPTFNSKVETDLEFAVRLERYCGYEAGSLLTKHETGIITIKSEWLEQSLKSAPSVAENEKFSCLMNAIAAADFEKQGFRIGFIGNEAYSDEKPNR